MDKQEAEIHYIQPNETLTVSSIFIKLLPVPDKNLFSVGTHCEAIYSQDGKYFPCLIENIEGDVYHVKYKKYNNKSVF